MFKLRIYCNDGNDSQYWEDGIGQYETYDKALIACFRNALDEAAELMMDADYGRYFEVETDFKITDTYANDQLKDVGYFPVATVFYDHAPQDRENDCEIQIVTGYDIVRVENNPRLAKYNEWLRETHGHEITVELKSYIEYDNSEWFYYTSARYGDSDAYETIEEAYKEADSYLHGVGELW